MVSGARRCAGCAAFARCRRAARRVVLVVDRLRRGRASRRRRRSVAVARRAGLGEAAAALVGLRALPARRARSSSRTLVHRVEARGAVVCAEVAEAALALRHLDIAPPAIRRGSATGCWSATGRGCGGWWRSRSCARLRARVRPTWARRRSSSRPARPCSSSERWCGNRPSSQPGRNTVSNSSPLAECSVMMLTASSPSPLVGVHHQRDVLEEAREVLELLHRAHQLLQVLQPAGGVGAAVLLPHLGVAGSRRARSRPARCAAACPSARASGRSSSIDVAQRAARLGLQLVGRDDRARGLGQRHAALARVVVQQLDGGVAEPALGHVDDALEGEIVGRRVDHAQIGQRVADFGALVEARAADHAIGQAERDEAVFELAHLERGAHQDRDLVERVAAALQLLDLLADRARLFLANPRRR